ncbi:phosphoenolpyruvate carboxylase [Alphaproteobacteria bacterium]|nr:phosphoenolpyruvate carboxylase [Alphaproteobacteria bacterium]
MTKKIELSSTIHLLGEILGSVIKKQENTAIFDKIEKIRTLSKNSRGNNESLNKQSFKKLKNQISNLTSTETLIIAKSFSRFLDFSNIAESLYSIHNIHDHVIRKTQETNEIVILEEALLDVQKNPNVSKNKFFNVAKNISIDLVLTAHPTEVKRRTLIQKYANVNNILDELNNLQILKKQNIKREKGILEKKLKEEITSVWKTDEIKRSRPTAVEEAKWGLAVIEDSLWNSIPKICSRFDNAVKKFTNKNLPINYSPIKVSSWMGGDRDGNPNVTSKTTMEVVLLSRWEAASLYEKEFTKLIQSLSLFDCSKKIKKQVGKTWEPYRVFLRPIRNKLQQTQREIEDALLEKRPPKKQLLVNSINEILDPLNEVYNSLCSVKCDIIANGLVLDIIRLSHTFGLNLAKLDIRQESSRHTSLLNTICKKLALKEYTKLSEQEKIKFLTREYKSKRPLIPNKIKFNNTDKETWETFKMIANTSNEFLGAYVISMTSKVSDILAVLLLQKEAGVKSPLRIVPLFETLSDLQNSSKIVDNLFKNRWYTNIFSNEQEIMIGYSDSSKDAGKFAASWAQYCAQEKLCSVANKHKIKLNFFHGRGGSVGRGGGPVYAALLSQPPGTVMGMTRVTEQGEVIQQKYGSESMAEYSLGTYIGAVLEATLSPPSKPSKEWRALIDSMSIISSKAYRHYLLEDEDFLKYFDKVTPKNIIGKLYIGSRPSKRNASKDIKSLRAIPWVFAWTQIRMLLPAWLGTYEALNFASKGKNKKILDEMIKNWPFFYEMMDMLDMVLIKTDQRVIRYYEECLANPELKKIGNELRAKLTELIEINKKIIPNHIINQRKAFRKSIKLRNTYAEILNLLQADIMKRLNKKNINPKSKKILMDAMIVTISGISASMKNTG